MENANYYAIIPASVRYDSRLKANEKLLYGEISALTNKEGFCWATNNYFAELYGVSKQSISSWIKNLQKYGYIKIDIQYEGREVKARCISIIPEAEITQNEEENTPENSDTPIQKNLNTYTKKLEYPYTKNFVYPIQKNLKENNTRYINTSINNKKKNIKKKSPTFEEVRAYVSEKKLNVDADAFFRYFEEGSWIDSRGKPVLNWKQKLLTWNSFQKQPDKQTSKKTRLADEHDYDVEMLERALFGDDG